ncbi:hypothetical protein Tco_0247758 [Tanacetum coccineum]
MKREGKDFSGRVTPLFATMMVQANQEEGADSATPIDSHSTPIITQPSSSKPQKKKSTRKQRKDSVPTKSTTEETTLKENSRVLALETTKSNQALEIKSLKRRLEEQEKDVDEKEVSVVDPVTTASEVVTTPNVEVTIVNAPTTTIDELTLAQTLIEIKAAKPKAITSATTTTTTRPKARGLYAKDKGKGIMVKPKVPLKKKDQVALDEEMARNLEAQLQAELIEEKRIARQK